MYIKSPIAGVLAKQRKSGFNLIAVMITVAIAAILSAIAMPIYYKRVCQMDWLSPMRQEYEHRLLIN